MFILRNILHPLQQEFKHRCKGDERGVWFVYILLAVITHFTSSRSANLLRCLQTLFGLSLSQRRFYIFMASSKLPWSYMVRPVLQEKIRCLTKRIMHPYIRPWDEV